jgi:DNA-binding CsgD family transcriptional regulator
MHFVDSKRECTGGGVGISTCAPVLPTEPTRTDASPTYALDYLNQGVVMTDHHSVPLWSNRVAHEIFEEADGLSIEPFGLSAARNSEAATLRRLIAAAAESAAEASGVMTVSRPSMRRSLELVVVPARRTVVPGAAAIVFINDPERSVPLPPDFLRQLYGLTLAEAAVVMEIAHGNGLESAAHKLGIAKSTARTHLQRAFHKTGTRRQSQLAWLIAKCCAVLPLEYLHRASLQGTAGALTEIKFAESVSGADDVAKN